MAFPTAAGPLPAGEGGMDGKAIFLAQKCDICHSVSTAGIEAKSKAMKAPDLVGVVTAEHDAKWIGEYVRKQVDLDGKKHGKAFTGSDEELKALIDLVWASRRSSPPQPRGLLAATGPRAGGPRSAVSHAVLASFAAARGAGALRRRPPARGLLLPPGRAGDPARRIPRRARKLRSCARRGSPPPRPPAAASCCHGIPAWRSARGEYLG